jgi:hypothetical protein
VREPRGQFAKIADTIGGAMRRRQRDREPRVLVYGADGRPQRLPGDEANAAVVELAERLVVLATGRELTDQPGPDEEEAE